MPTHVACQGLEKCKPRLQACKDVKEECTLFFEKKKSVFCFSQASYSERHRSKNHNNQKLE